MKFVDAYILARTKRKTRRIRTALVVIVSSLLFALLFGIAFLAQGLINAGSQVGEVGFNSRNLTTVMPITQGEGFDYEAMIKRIEKQMDAELRARDVEVTKNLKGDLEYQTERERRMAKSMEANQLAANQKTERRLKSLGNPTDVYHFSSLPLSQMASYQPDPKIDPYVQSLQKQEDTGQPEPAKGFDPFGSSLEFFGVEAGMLRTQVAPGQTLGWRPGQPYPVIVSYSYLEKLSSRPLTNLSPKERNAGYRQLIKEDTGQELRYCYRNSTAQDQLRAVFAYNTMVEKDKLAATKPVDIKVCRGFDQKQLKKLGIISEADPTGSKPLFPRPKVPAAVTKNISFKIVGFVPAPAVYGGADIVTQILTSIGSLPTGPYPGVLPLEVIKADPVLTEVAGGDIGYNFPTLFVDFKTRADQKAFVAKGCSGMDCNQDGALVMSPFGNIKSSLEGVFRFVSKTLFIAALVIMIIAGLMIMFTISKVIADSVKEIAVFRSLGARRRDIAQIYYTYGLMLAGSALVVAVVLAAVGAYVLTVLYDDKIAQGLVQATGAFNNDITVVLLGIQPIWVLGIVGALLLAATLGIAVPVLASVRRKLITILREE